VWQAKRATWQSPVLARAVNAADNGALRLRGRAARQDVKSLRIVWREYYKNKP
jgi:hypothetical protein